MVPGPRSPSARAGADSGAERGRAAERAFLRVWSAGAPWRDNPAPLRTGSRHTTNGPAKALVRSKSSGRGSLKLYRGGQGGEIGLSSPHSAQPGPPPPSPPATPPLPTAAVVPSVARLGAVPSGRRCDWRAPRLWGHSRGVHAGARGRRELRAHTDRARPLTPPPATPGRTSASAGTLGTNDEFG